MGKALVSLKMVMNTKANYDTVFFTGKELLNGLTELFIKENSVKTKSLAKVTTLGLMEAHTEVKFLMVSDMELEHMLTIKKALNMKEIGLMECVTVTVNFDTKTVQFIKEIGARA
jgi:hypothetical protein